MQTDSPRPGPGPGGPPIMAVETTDDTVVALFEHQAARHPDILAVVRGDIRWSFAELDARANRLARTLIADGIGPEDVVAIVLPRTAGMIAATLGVLKSGAAYLPLDPADPPARTAAALTGANPVAVITTTTIAADFLHAAGAGPDLSSLLIVALDHPATIVRIAAHAADAPVDADRVQPLLPQHPAYVTGASGPSGRPGVVVTHAELVDLFRDHNADPHRPAREAAGRRHLRVGHAWSFASDASWWPQLWLLDGHTLHIVSEDVRRDPAARIELARTEGIDFIEPSPSQLGRFADLGMTGPDGRIGPDGRRSKP